MINISKRYFSVELKDCKFLGKGREGKVYLVPNGYALKIFNNKKNCEDQYTILKKVEGSRYFPKAVSIEGKAMLREYVGGISLGKYIKTKGFPQKLIFSLLCLLEEFERLGFTRLDISERNIYVEENQQIKVIDPRKVYVKKISIPSTLLKELEELNVLDNFIKTALEVKPKFALKCMEEINRVNY
ncbi:serine/threonine protein kinase [Clostridium bovifaecis]|uniref:Serine/threonine protein kinase n=1 Tax=Clostridium bovifaecis TaxID=2184719 RepID=A0A6I6EPL0_9CLOT|nr:serine/threonine protein kinase [Clostridium bovifaecis]